MKEITDETGVNLAQTENNYIVFFCTATWCGPCRSIKKVFPEIEAKYTNIAFYLCDVDEEEFPFADTVTCMPTFLLFVKNNCVDTVKGASRENLEKALDKMLYDFPIEVEKVEEEVEEKVEEKVEKELLEKISELEIRLKSLKERLKDIRDNKEKTLMEKIKERDEELINSTHTDINDIGEERVDENFCIDDNDF